MAKGTAAFWRTPGVSIDEPVVQLRGGGTLALLHRWPVRRQLRDHGSFGRMIGSAPTMRRVYQVVEQAAPTAASVLIATAVASAGSGAVQTGTKTHPGHHSHGSHRVTPDSPQAKKFVGPRMKANALYQTHMIADTG